GELQTVSRPARDGDHVSIDRKLTVHGETVLAADDELYEVGAGTIVEELDTELRGKRSGDIIKFNATVPEHGEVTFTVLVKEVRETVLPEVTDEWASEASEFETVAELREDIFRRTDAIKRLQASLAVRDKVLEALIELVDEDMPEALVTSEFGRRVENLQHRLGHQNATIADYLQATGQTEEQLAGGLRAESEAALKADLALQAVADIESIEVTDEELDAHIDSLAERRNEKPNALRRRLQSEGELPAVRSGLRKTKAMEWLVEHTEYVDEDGRVIDRSELEPRPPEASQDDESPADDAVPAEETAR
ncbi:MAG: trigger factor, partial [Acidimicrobiales bacterium]